MSLHKKTQKSEVDQLLKLLQSEKPSVRARAVLKLCEMGPGAVEPLLESLPQGELPGAGSSQETIIISVLAKMGRKITPLLMRSLDSANGPVRELSAIVLGEIKDRASLEALHRASRDASVGSIEHILLHAAISKIEAPHDSSSDLTIDETESLPTEPEKEEKSAYSPMYL